MNSASKIIWEIIPTLGGGGAEKMVLDLADGIMQAGYTVKVISLYGPNEATKNRLDYAEDKGIDLLFLDKHKGFDIRILGKLIKMMKRDNPAIIHTHLSAFQYLAILGYTYRFNHVHTMHSIIGNESKTYQLFLNSVSRRQRTHFVVLSPQIEKSMKNIYNISDKNISCIPNGIDRSIYSYSSRNTKNQVLTFIAVGSLIPVKNHALLLRAFARFIDKRESKDRLVILGEGSLRDELEILIEELDIKDLVDMPGNVDNVVEYLRNSDVFVLTSHYEGVSLALLEAASTGLPIITTGTGATPEVVKNDALLIDDDNVEQLVSKMLLLAENPDIRCKYMKKAASIAERFDKYAMVDSYLSIFDNIISWEN